MSLEVWSTVASIGTFVVISATAIAALVQLRHMRNSNQIAVYAHIQARQDAPELIAAQRFASHELAERMNDPVFRQALTAVPTGDAARVLLPIMNTFEGMGTLVKHGFIDRDIVLDLYGGAAIGYWNALAPVIRFFAANRETRSASTRRAAHARRYEAGWTSTQKYDIFAFSGTRGPGIEAPNLVFTGSKRTCVVFRSS